MWTIFPKNWNLGISFRSSNTSYHMLNNKYTEGEYYNFFQLQQTFIGCLPWSLGIWRRSRWGHCPQGAHSVVEDRHRGLRAQRREYNFCWKKGLGIWEVLTEEMTLEQGFERWVEVLVTGREGILGRGTHRQRLIDSNVSAMFGDD